MAAVRLIASFLVLLIAGCASPPPGAGVAGTGVVQSITEGKEASQTGQVVGAVGGAVLGGWLGSNIGGGAGQTIATAAGSVAGGMAGSAVGSQASVKAFWDVTVRFDDGIDRPVRVYARPAFRPGDRVAVSNGVITPLR
jgi:outer membrane lipoprotein SlyB